MERVCKHVDYAVCIKAGDIKLVLICMQPFLRMPVLPVVSPHCQLLMFVIRHIMLEDSD